MPSLRSHFFRFISRRVSGVLASRSTIAEWRALASAGINRPRLAKGVSLKKASVGSIPVEWLIPRDALSGRAILHIHGGGWILGWDSVPRFMISLLARYTRVPAFAVDYRLAPEHPFPAALEDCLTAYEDLLEQGYTPDKIALVGDSAGGNLVLAAMLALKARGEHLPGCGACLSPVTDLSTRSKSYTLNAKKEAILPLNFTAACGPAYLHDQDPRNPLISPIYGDLSGLPPLLIQAGGDELLLDDATCFAEKARQAGVDARLEVYPGMWHVWQIYAPYLPEAQQAMRSIARFVNQQLN